MWVENIAVTTILTLSIGIFARIQKQINTVLCITTIHLTDTM